MKKRRGRQRKPENAWMPDNVRRDRGVYVYRDIAAGEYYRLADADASQADVWKAYEAMRSAPVGYLNDVIEAYFRSTQFAGLAPSTQYDYRQYARRIRNVFGAMVPDTISSPWVQMFMDERGRNYPVAANHEKAFLSILMNWGKARGYSSIPNPCDSVKNYKRPPAGRYVEHTEYLAFYEHLLAHGNKAHAAAMEIAYLCGARQGDVRRLLMRKPRKVGKADCYVTEDGLVIWQAKTGKVQLKEWNPDLRAAVALAKEVQPRVASLHVIHTQSGTEYTRGGFNTMWRKRQLSAIKDNVLAERFRFHDLKIKALSDFEGTDLVHFSGHKSQSQAQRYNRTPDRVAALRRPI